MTPVQKDLLRKLYEDILDLQRVRAEVIGIPAERVHQIVHNKQWQSSGRLPAGLDNQFGNQSAHEQQILTPSNITDFVRDLLGGQISLDPCAADDERDTVKARVRLFGGPSDNGLIADWVDGTFVNPPFKSLKKWLEKALAEVEFNLEKRVFLLAPVRSQRVWWRYARDLCKAKGTFLELNPVTFVGYTQPYPPSMCLFCFNVQVPDMIRWKHEL